MCRGGTLQSAECHLCFLVAECHPGTSFSLRNFTPVVRKVSLQDFLLVLGAPRAKITNWSFWPACDQIRYFWPACDQNLGSAFWAATMGHIFKILPWRDFGPLRQWSRKFPFTIYHPFWPSYGRKFWFGLFDQGATKWVKFPNFSPGESILDRNLTPVVPKVSLQNFLLILTTLPPKILIRSFWPKCDQMG